jgi:adenylate cyclase
VKTPLRSVAGFLSALPRESLALPLAAAFLILSVVALYVFQPPAVRKLDLRVYDLLLPFRIQGPPPVLPAVVDIDEKSLALLGQWPWPRYRAADLVKALESYGVAGMGFDVIFAEPDRASPERLREELARDRGVSPEISGIPPELLDYDQILADALKGAPAVLGAYAGFGEGGEPPLLPLPVDPPAVVERLKPGSPGVIETLPEARTATLPLPRLLQAAPAGFLNAVPDIDGTVRELPVVVRFGDRVYPSLALRTLMRAAGAKRLTLFGGPGGLERVETAGLSVPADRRGMLRPPFRPGGSFDYFSAADVLAGNIPRRALQGRIVFIGSSAPGLSDTHSTPGDQYYPGVESHCAAVEAFLLGDQMSVPAWTPAAQLALIILCGALSAWLFGRLRPRIYVPAGFLLAAILALSSAGLARKGIFLSPLWGLGVLALEGAALTSFRFRRAERQKNAIKRVFSRYVAPEVARIVSNSGEDYFSGEERELTIMFTDIRGFTTLSETLSPREVVSMLNSYFGVLTAIVLKEKGTLDKFIGDALMAYWNAPLKIKGHNQRAVSAALAMRDGLPDLNRSLQESLGLSINFGVGVHTGSAFVGNLGSESLVNYTLIGDNVNLASRLEGLCGLYGVAAVVSGETRAGCGPEFDFRFLDSIRVKGKTRPVDVYEPLRAAETAPRRSELALWDEARGFYREGDFVRAVAALEELARSRPEDPVYDVFLKRCRALNLVAPADWDGIWTAGRK